MVVIDTHLAREPSNGGFTFHDRGGPCGRTKGAKRIVAVDVTGLPVGALVVPASTHENRASELMLEHLARQVVTGRLELVLVDRGVTAGAARKLGRHHDHDLRRVGWDDKQPVFRAHPARLASRSRPRQPRTLPPAGEVVREHHHLGDRLAASGRHRDHPAPPVTRTGAPARTAAGSLTLAGLLRGRRQIGPFARRRARGVVVEDGGMTSAANPSAIADAVHAFFSKHEVASLRLPSGWFGRPHDNQHQLTEARTTGDGVVIRLDERQILTLDAEGASREAGVLRVAIRGGRWDWTEYGGDAEHSEVLGSGVVEFHAPFLH